MKENTEQAINFLSKNLLVLKSMVKDYERNQKVKTAYRILVISHSSHYGDALVKYLREKGFVNASVQIPNAPIHELDAEVIIFHRSGFQGEPRYIDTGSIIEYVKKNQQNQILFYFGPRNEELDPRTHRIYFANFRTKLVSNLMEILEERSHSDSPAP